MAANLRDPGSIPGGDPKRFQDSSNYVFYIVGECFSSAADTHLATDLTCKVYTVYSVHTQIARKNNENRCFHTFSGDIRNDCCTEMFKGNGNSKV